MKNIAFILMLIFPLTSFGKGPIDNFKGCYQTLKVNGENVVHPNFKEKSKVVPRSSVLYYLGEDYNDIPGTDIKIFLRMDPNRQTGHYAYHPIFHDRGTWNNGRYHFQGVVRVKVAPQVTIELNQYISLKRLSKNRIQIDVTGEDDYFLGDQSTQYLLKKVRCR